MPVPCNGSCLRAAQGGNAAQRCGQMLPTSERLFPMAQWKLIAYDPGSGDTQRMAVPGGWLIANGPLSPILSAASAIPTSLCASFLSPPETASSPPTCGTGRPSGRVPPDGLRNTGNHHHRPVRRDLRDGVRIRRLGRLNAGGRGVPGDHLAPAWPLQRALSCTAPATKPRQSQRLP